MTIAVVIRPYEAVIFNNISSFIYNSQTQVFTYWVSKVDHFRLTQVLGITGLEQEET